MKRLCVILLALTTASCSTGRLQPHVNNLVTAQQPSAAFHALQQNPPTSYGRRNELLYWLDKGLTAQLAGQFQESVAAFSAADKKFDELYTRSLSQGALTWVLNDYTKDYQGSDQEYVLVSLLQAINFALLGNIDEALVEARRADQKLKMVAGRYKKEQYDVYSDDPFARFFSGVLWQASGTPEGLNNAHISYSRALKLYAQPPPLLLDNLKVTQAFMDSGRLPPQDKAEVYVIEYTGFSPIKTEEWIQLPLLSHTLTKLAFAHYVHRYSQVQFSLISAVRDRQQYFEQMQLGENIGEIAVGILDNQRTWLVTKGLVRPMAKYALEKALEDQMRRSYGDGGGILVGIFSSIFNLTTERADLRSWQTLPNTILIGRLALEPGTYEIFIEDLSGGRVLVEKKFLRRLTLKAGEKKFLLTRSYR